MKKSITSSRKKSSKSAKFAAGVLAIILGMFPFAEQKVFGQANPPYSGKAPANYALNFIGFSTNGAQINYSGGTGIIIGIGQQNNTRPTNQYYAGTANNNPAGGTTHDVNSIFNYNGEVIYIEDGGGNANRQINIAGGGKITLQSWDGHAGTYSTTPANVVNPTYGGYATLEFRNYKGAATGKFGGVINIISGDYDFVGAGTVSYIYGHSAPSSGSAWNLSRTTVQRGSTISFYDNDALHGGAIYLNDGSINLANVNFGFLDRFDQKGTTTPATANALSLLSVRPRGNTATGSGGAVYISTGTVNFSNTVFICNEANLGGAVYNRGTFSGGGTFGQGVQYGFNTGNTALTSGGAVYNDGGRVTIGNGSTFLENTAGTYGGAIYSTGNAGVINIGTSDISSYVAFNDNSVLASTGSGGAIYNVLGATANINGARFERNTARNQGGAIYNASVLRLGTVTILTSTATDGAGIYVARGGVVTNTDPIFIQENIASRYGGGIYNYQGNVNLNNGTFGVNKALYGGAIYNDDGPLTLNNIRFTNNEATNGHGGAIYSTGQSSNLVLSLVQFEDNIATNGSGGAIYNQDRGVITITDTGTVLQSMFRGNMATGDGGAIFNGTNATLTIRGAAGAGAEFSQNRSLTGRGGAIFNAENAVLDVINTTFSENYVPITGIFGASNQDGGAIYNLQLGTLKVANSSFVNNIAYRGGAIFNDDDGITGGNPSNTLNSVTFENNGVSQLVGFQGQVVTAYGGAIFNDGALLVTNGTFDGNKVKVDGGAIYNNEDEILTISGGTFLRNEAVGDGGAIYNNDGVLTLSAGAFFQDNKATLGGAIYNLSTEADLELVLTNPVFYRNEAKSGAAIYNDGTSLRITGVPGSTASPNFNFQENTAADKGGVIFNCQDRTLTIESARFDLNSATGVGAGNDGFGGVIYNDVNGVVDLSKVYFTRNTALSGGVIYNNEGVVTINTAEFGDNTLSNANEATLGGAIYNSAGTINLTDVSFTSNRATGGLNSGAIYNDAGIINVNIVSNNQVLGRTDGTDGQYDSVYFNGTGNEFNVNVAEGRTFTTYGGLWGPGNVAIEKTGAGKWVHARRSDLTGTAGFTVSNGELELAANSWLDLNASNGTFTMDGGLLTLGSRTLLTTNKFVSAADNTNINVATGTAFRLVGGGGGTLTAGTAIVDTGVINPATQATANSSGFLVNAPTTITAASHEFLTNSYLNFGALTKAATPEANGPFLNLNVTGAAGVTTVSSDFYVCEPTDLNFDFNAGDYIVLMEVNKGTFADPTVNTLYVGMRDGSVKPQTPSTERGHANVYGLELRDSAASKTDDQIVLTGWNSDTKAPADSHLFWTGATGGGNPLLWDRVIPETEGAWTDGTDNWYARIGVRDVFTFLNGDSITFADTYVDKDGNTQTVTNKSGIYMLDGVIVGDMNVNGSGYMFDFTQAGGGIVIAAKEDTGAVDINGTLTISKGASGNINFGTAELSFTPSAGLVSTITADGTITLAKDSKLDLDVHNYGSPNYGNEPIVVFTGAKGVSLESDIYLSDGITGTATLVDMFTNTTNPNGRFVLAGIGPDPSQNTIVPLNLYVEGVNQPLGVRGAGIGVDMYGFSYNNTVLGEANLLVLVQDDSMENTTLYWRGGTTGEEDTWDRVNGGTPGAPTPNWYGKLNSGLIVSTFMDDDSVIFDNGVDVKSKDVKLAEAVTIGDMTVSGTDYVFDLSNGSNLGTAIIEAKVNAATGAVGDIDFGSATLDKIGINTAVTAAGDITFTGSNGFGFNLIGVDNGDTMLTLTASAVNGTVGDGDITVDTTGSIFAGNQGEVVLVATDEAGVAVATGALTVDGKTGSDLNRRSDTPGTYMYGIATSADDSDLLLKYADSSLTADGDLRWIGSVNDTWDRVGGINDPSTRNWDGKVNEIAIKQFMNGDSVLFDDGVDVVRKDVKLAEAVTVNNMTVTGTDYIFDLSNGAGGTILTATGDIDFGTASFSNIGKDTTIETAGTVNFDSGNGFGFNLNGIASGDTMLILTDATSQPHTAATGPIGDGRIDLATVGHGLLGDEGEVVLIETGTSGVAVDTGTIYLDGSLNPYVAKRGGDELMFGLATGDNGAATDSNLILLYSKADANTEVVWTGADPRGGVRTWDGAVENDFANWYGKINGIEVKTFLNGDSAYFGNNSRKDGSGSNLTPLQKMVTVSSDGVIVAEMNVVGDGYLFNLAANGNLPAITADTDYGTGNINLGTAMLNINEYTPAEQDDVNPYDYVPGDPRRNIITVIRAEGTLARDNSNPLIVQVNNQPIADFLSATAWQDNNEIKVETRLTWYSTERLSKARGDFTIDSDSFTLGAVLKDITEADCPDVWANRRADWDGTTLTKYGAGTLILTADNTYTGLTAVTDGNLRIGNGGTTGSVSGNIDVAGGTNVTFNRSDIYTYGYVISGDGSMTQAGPGTLILTADNEYEGGTKVEAGILQLGDNTASGSVVGDIEVAGGANVTFKRSDEYTFDNIIFGNGSVTQAGTGKLIFITDHEYTGGTTVNTGTVLQLGNSTASGEVKGNILDNGEVIFNRSDDYTFGGIISGTGDLTQVGPGMLTLTGNNTFTGITTVATGTELQIGNGGTTGSVISNIVNNGNVTFNRSNTETYRGVISGGGTVTKLGAGTLILTGENTYTGLTTVTTGILQIGDGGTTGSVVSGIFVDNGTRVDFNRRDNNALYGGAFTGTGDVRQIGSGTLTLTGDSSGFDGRFTQTNGTVHLAGTANLGGTFTQNANTTLTADKGATLNVATFGGTVFLDITDADSVTAIITVLGDAVFTNTAKIRIDNTTPAVGDVKLISGGSMLDPGDIYEYVVAPGRGGGYYENNTLWYGSIASGSELTWNGTNTQGDWNTDTNNKNWKYRNFSNTWFETNDNVLFDNTAENKNVKVNSGGVTVTNMRVLDDYTFTGGVITAKETVTVENGGSLGLTIGNTASLEAGAVTFDVGSALNINGYTPDETSPHNNPKREQTLIKTTGGVTGFDTVTLTIDRQATTDFLSAVARLDGNDVKVETSLTWYSDILERPAHGDFTVQNEFEIGRLLENNDASTNRGIDKSGNLWDGTTLTKYGAGTLILTADNTYTGLTKVTEGKLQLGNDTNAGSVRGDIEVEGGANVTFKRSNTETYDGVISGDGSLTQAGTGTLVLTNTNTYAGGTTVEAGTLQLGDNTGTGSVEGDITNNGNVTFKRSDEVIYDGVISGTGSLTQAGTGKLILTENNTFTGGTTVNAGTSLQLGNNTSAGWVEGDIANSGNVTFFNSEDKIFSDIISGTGSVTKKGDTVLTLTGSNIYTGLTKVEEGSLQIGNGGTTGSVTSNIRVDDGANVTFNRSSDYTFGNALFGPGTMTKKGGNTLTLTADSIGFTGAATVEDGKLLIGNLAGTPAALGGEVVVESGAQLAGYGKVGGQVTVQNGAEFSPGDFGKAGTFTAGSINFQNGSTYQYDITGTENDLLMSNGTVDIESGAKLVVNASERGKTGTKYQVIGTTNGGSINENQFFTLNNKRYKQWNDGSEFWLTWMGMAEMIGPYGSQNAINIGGLFDEIDGNDYLYGELLDLFTALDTMAPKDMADALAQLHGEIYASNKEAAAQLHRNFQRYIPTCRNFVCPGVRTKKLNCWANVTGDWQERNSISRGEYSGYALSSAGVAVGLDQAVTNGGLLGVAFGYDDANQNFRTISSQSQIETFRAIFYSSWCKENYYIDSYTGYSRNCYDNRRNINIRTSGYELNRTARSNYNDDMFSAGFELGQVHQYGGFMVTPSLGLHYIYLSSPTVTEKDGGIANLYIAGGNYGTLRMPVGAKLHRNLAGVYGAVWSPEIRAFYVREMGHDSATVLNTLNFDDDTRSLRCKASSGPIGRNGGQIGVGFAVHLPSRLNFRLNYDCEFFSNTATNVLSAALGFQW